MFSQQEKQRLEQVDLENLVGFFNILYQVDKRNEARKSIKKPTNVNCAEDQPTKN